MIKHIKKLAVVCVAITMLNIVYTVTHNHPVDIHALTGLRMFSKGVRFVPVGYHHDRKHGLMVIQQQDPRYLSEEKQFWNFDYDPVRDKDMDIHYINGYNYTEEAVRIDAVPSGLNASLVELTEHEISFMNGFTEFFVELFELIEKSEPKTDSLQNDEHYAEAKKTNKFPNNNGRVMIYGGHLREQYKNEPIRTKEMLGNYLRLSTKEVEALSKSHAHFLKYMPRNIPEKLVSFGQYSHFMKGDGIVYLGGDRYNQLVLLSIKTLRSNGSKLPVEVIMPKRDDYDLDLCNKLLPKLNAKCKVMEDFLPDVLMRNINGYQLKTIALMISSFERVLYLDADNLPIKNPDMLLTNEPFTNHHLVIWPDLWRRSTSPHFYEIADINVNVNHRVRNSYFLGDPRGSVSKPEDYSMHDCMGLIPEASSETGQLLINKRIHFATLVLLMYYNYYGPSYYYPLLSQGAAGEGDKETFIAAAHKLELPYYQVQEFNREFGPINQNTNKHELFGMGQYDPIIDYIQSQEKGTQPGEARKYVTEEKPTYGFSDTDNKHNNYHYHMFKASSLFFLHANWPKYLVEELFLHNSFGRGPKDGDQRRRLYNRDMIVELAGYDFELQVMENVKWCFCDLFNVNLKGVPESTSENRVKICQEVYEQIDFLKGAK